MCATKMSETYIYLELTHAYLTLAILISIGVLPATSGKNEGGM